MNTIQSENGITGDGLMHAFDETPDDYIMKSSQFSLSKGIQFPSSSNLRPKSSSFTSVVPSQTCSVYPHFVPITQRETQEQERHFPEKKRDSQVTIKKSTKLKTQTSVQISPLLGNSSPAQVKYMERDSVIENEYNLTTKIQNTITTPRGFQQQLLTPISIDNQLSPSTNRRRSLLSSFHIIYNVKRFMTQIFARGKQRIFFRRVHFQMINDLASEPQQNLGELYSFKNTKRKRRRCMRVFRRWCAFDKLAKYFQFVYFVDTILKYVPLIYPEDKFKRYWDTIRAILLLYFFILIPIEVSFSNQILFGILPIVTNISMVFLMIDYVLKMNTVYFEKGKAITSRSLIIEKYFKDGFLIDGFAILILWICQFNQWYLENEWIKFLLLVFFTQVNYFSRYITNLEEQTNLSKFTVSVLNLAKLLSMILFVVHLFSCIWYKAGDYMQRVIDKIRLKNGQPNWLTSRHIQDDSWQIQYLQSLYFSTVTILTVGYGDITPQNSLEITLCILVVFFGCIQLSYSVNTVGIIIKSMTETQDLAREKLRIINSYMDDKKISFALQYQVREYLKDYWLEEYQEQSQAQAKILDQLSLELRDQITIETFSNFIRRSKFGFSDLSDDIKLQILKSIHTVLINPESVVSSHMDEFNENCLCYIESGELDIIHSKLNFTHQQSVLTLKQGQFFGEDEFITDKKSEVYYRSHQFVRLNILKRSDFIGIIKQSPPDYEKFCMMKDKIQFQWLNRDKTCESCYQTGHTLSSCDLLHYVPDKEKIIKRYQYKQDQRRQEYIRNTVRQKNIYNAILDQPYLQTIGAQIQDLDFQIIKYYDEYESLEDHVGVSIHLQHLAHTATPVNLPPLPQPINFISRQRIQRATMIYNAGEFNFQSNQCIKQSFEKSNKVISENASPFDAATSPALQGKKKQINLEIARISQAELFAKSIRLNFKRLSLNVAQNQLDQKSLLEFILLLKKIENIFEVDFRKLNQFQIDHKRDFSEYFPHENPSQIIEVCNQKTSPDSHIEMVNEKLLKYMLFPQLYVDRYITKKGIQGQNNKQNRKKVRKEKSFKRHHTRRVRPI